MLREISKPLVLSVLIHVAALGGLFVVAPYVSAPTLLLPPAQMVQLVDLPAGGGGGGAARDISQPTPKKPAPPPEPPKAEKPPEPHPPEPKPQKVEKAPPPKPKDPPREPEMALPTLKAQGTAQERTPEAGREEA